MTTYDELTPDALFLLENLSELDIVQDCADRGAKIAELREELVQQRERADNAEARLDLARQALVIDGYFTRAEVGDEGSPDIAPRITELAVHLRAELVSRPTTCRQPAYDAVFTLIRSLPSSDIGRNGVIWQAVTSALDAANIPDCRAAGHDSASHIGEVGPDTEYRNFSRGIPWELPPRWIATELLDDADPPFDFSSILGDYQRYADETDAHAAAVEAALVEQRKCKVIVPHAFQQVPDVDIAVCTCTKSPGHHIHAGDRAACTCDECHPEEPTP